LRWRGRAGPRAWRGDGFGRRDGWDKRRSQGVTETEKAVTETEMAVTETPSAVTETPSAVTETPSAVTETPSAVTETRKAVTETRKAVTETQNAMARRDAEMEGELSSTSPTWPKERFDVKARGKNRMKSCLQSGSVRGRPEPEHEGRLYRVRSPCLWPKRNHFEDM
jgi:hypothetical protein